MNKLLAFNEILDSNEFLLCSHAILATVEKEHSKIERGDHYFCSDVQVGVGAGSVVDYQLETPASVETHLLLSIQGTQETELQILEAGDRVGTTGLSIYNSDRNSGNSYGGTIDRGVGGGTTDGTQIFNKRVGSFFNTGLIVRNNELILIPATKYIFRITSRTAGNNISTIFNFYIE